MMSCFGGAFGTLLSLRRVAIFLWGRSVPRLKSQRYPGCTRCKGLDAARCRPYLNEPSFTGPAIQTLSTRRSATVQARETRTNDKRARILDAAVKVFAERGFHSATVAEIARAAGVADGTIYLYFKSKDDLLLELFDEKMTQLIGEAKTAMAE